MTGTAIARTKAQKNRGTIFVEDGEVIEVTTYPAEQYVFRLAAPLVARNARPGSFVHAQCDIELPMRRPLSIMRANGKEGWIDLLFKVVGEGLRLFAAKKPGDKLSLIGPIGHPFEPDPERPNSLLIGGGVGIPPMIFLTETLVGDTRDWHPLVVMGSEVPFPFELQESAIACDWLPADTSSAMPLLEQWQIPSRLASLSEFDGCHRGFVTDLAAKYLASLTAKATAKTAIYACGPTAMLEATADLAREYDIPCQVSLEEFMACGVGGCAGCTVLVQTPDGPAMSRVCVDGPVFEAATVFPKAPD
ncbi:MAG: dihydroorotate dehydrogenase electron transfer subunit [Woeseiaceae bacterium]